MYTLLSNLTYPSERRITSLYLHRAGKLYGGCHVLPVYELGQKALRDIRDMLLS